MSQGRLREQWITQCVEQVLLRLQQRQQAELVLSLPQLTSGWPADAALRHARLRVTDTTSAFLRRLADGRQEDAALNAIRQAWRDGMRVRLEIDRGCFGLLPVAGLLRLPLRLCTPDNSPVHLLARAVAGYADIRPLPAGYLVVARHVLLTALARDEIAKRRLQLYRQD
ncbi:PduM family microcompartment protein [Acerihabitans arboris]|uniref:PduM family microcompartment protein n=1 Tax=Acerihabitans arboris TaxID=2691583 RepID=A0A845SKQ8_9GAMM|nr:PduM family microcompartment protein [Acerihabitans arboris]NDL63201.1 PduM family microcompartment protein [Acerihabitans arboris]